MKKLLTINLGNFSSTGSIVTGISTLSEENDYLVVNAFPDHENNRKTGKHDYIICNDFTRKVNQKIALYSGLNGFVAPITTLKLIHKIKVFKPDIIHLHNLHNSYVNIKMLFSFFKKKKYKIIWTLHDCWSFTGLCTYFDMVECDKWKNACGECPCLNNYPSSKPDFTKTLLKKKKKTYLGVNITFVTPSNWLRRLTQESIIKDFPVMVINNGINLSVFHFCKSNFRHENHLDHKIIVLGVANDWGPRKGFDVFLKLREELPDNYFIVLVGLSKNQIQELKPGMLGIERTSNVNELVEIYSAADIFVNPTREENYPTVNMEAIACGTPVITFDTGGSSEMIDPDCGIIVKKNDIEQLLVELKNFKGKEHFYNGCMKKAKQFDEKMKYNEYLELYNRVII